MKIFFGIFAVSMLFLSSSIFPAIQGSNVSNLITSEDTIENNAAEFKLAEYLKKIHGQDISQNVNILPELQKYLFDENSKGPLFFEYIFKAMRNNIGDDEFDELMSFVIVTLQYLKSHEMNLVDFNNLLNKRIDLIQSHLHSIANGQNSEEIFTTDNSVLLDSSKTEKVSNMNSDFEEYWNRYERAKVTWDGNVIDEEGKLVWFPKYILNNWRGDNFHQWFYRACNYLYGIQDVKPFSDFRINNWIIFSISVVLGICSVLGFFYGFAGHDSGYVLGNFAGVFAMLFFFILAAKNYYTLQYFLFGINEFMMLFEWGNVKPIVEITSDDPQIFNSLEVKAISENAKQKYDEMDGFIPVVGRDAVEWSIDEFTYELHVESEQSYDENSKSRIYTICYPEYSYMDTDMESAHAQWKKAVPPPGDWTFYIEADGIKPVDPIKIEDIKPREAFRLTVELERQ